MTDEAHPNENEREEISQSSILMTKLGNAIALSGGNVKDISVCGLKRGPKIQALFLPA